jgi:superfamily II DNA/RNA helicase
MTAEACSFSRSALQTSKRCVIQSGQGSGDVLSAGRARLAAAELTKNRRGNYYRYKKKLWPSLFEMEIDLSKTLYEAVERTPITLLPGALQPQRAFQSSGRPLPTLLAETEEKSVAPHQPESAPSSALVSNPSATDLLFQQMSASSSIVDKIITPEDDLSGTPLASAQPIRDVMEDSTHETGATIPWRRLKLDPLIELICIERFGPTATVVQSRLLPALLNPDHNDVVMNGVTGSGKTTAMMIALVSALRLEDAGLNIFVASSAVNGMRMRDAIYAFVGDRGGSIADRAAEDLTSWIQIAVYREDFRWAHTSLMRSTNPTGRGPCRILIATADVLNEMLFEMKMEFAKFGYLRRVFVDDCGPQTQLLEDEAYPRISGSRGYDSTLRQPATADEIEGRNRDPVALELLLGTLHQMPGPHIRSIMQIACVSADLNMQLARHLSALCIKPEANSVVLSPNRLPSTIHCLFSFFKPRNEEGGVYEYLTKLMWNAQAAIPGRAIIYIRYEDNILEVRQKLRTLGVDAKILSEIVFPSPSAPTVDGIAGRSSTLDKPSPPSVGWKFVLLRENEAWGLDLPLVSHVFITFAPATWASYLHMCGRVGRIGNVGWAVTVCSSIYSKQMRQIAEALDVNLLDHVIDDQLRQVPRCQVDSMTKDHELWGLDPQFSVRQHYDIQSEMPEIAHTTREMWTKPFNRQFMKEDYTPVEVLNRRAQNARRISLDVQRDPSVAARLQKQGFVDRYMRPKKKLWQAISREDSKDERSLQRRSRR